MSGEIKLAVSDDREAPFIHATAEDAQEELTTVGNEQEKSDHCVVEIHNSQNKQEEKQQSRVTRERNAGSRERGEEEEEEEEEETDPSVDDDEAHCLLEKEDEKQLNGPRKRNGNPSEEKDEEEEVNPVEEEARFLLEIEKNKKLKVTLREWEKRYKVARERIEKKSARASNAKNELYQLIGFYSVFQGVVLTAVAQSSTIFCKQSWGPASLSLLASIVTVLSVHFKLIDYSELKSSLDQEIKDSKVLHLQIGELKARGKKFDFRWFKDKLRSKEKDKDKSRTETQKSEKRYYWAIIAALLLFSVIILLCCIIVLCDLSKCKSSSSSCKQQKNACLGFLFNSGFLWIVFGP
ncbi:unnamed protein product [Sphagnum jensenii]|uniref:Transmembrane protein n=1 Tax=Sphagnum jensenii TaxID=128206 RepID=A0ABP1AZ99_9BRYO